MDTIVMTTSERWVAGRDEYHHHVYVVIEHTPRIIGFLGYDPYLIHRVSEETHLCEKRGTWLISELPSRVLDSSERDI
jgi:hypothetical protein